MPLRLSFLTRYCCTHPIKGGAIAQALAEGGFRYVALGLHVLATEVPLLQQTLDLEPISLENWVILGVVAIIVLIVMEAQKWIIARQQD